MVYSGLCVCVTLALIPNSIRLIKYNECPRPINNLFALVLWLLLRPRQERPSKSRNSSFHCHLVSVNHELRRSIYAVLRFYRHFSDAHRTCCYDIRTFYLYPFEQSNPYKSTVQQTNPTTGIFRDIDWLNSYCKRYPHTLLG